MQLVKTVRFANQASVTGVQVKENPHISRIRLLIENCRCAAVLQVPAERGSP